MPSIVSTLEGVFGDVAGMGPGRRRFTGDIDTIIGNYEDIQAALDGGNYTVECRPDSDPNCEQRGGYVDLNVSNTIYLCMDAFYGQTQDQQATLIIHELAHAELNIEHEGGRILNFGCPADLDLEYEQAIGNAYAYDILAQCLGGAAPEQEVIEGGQPEGRGPHSEGSQSDEEHPENELGAFLLIPASGGLPGAEVRYMRTLGGHAPGIQAYGGVGASYLPHGHTLGLGLGGGARYTTDFNFFTQLGVGVEGSLELSPSGGGSPSPHAGAFGELEVGVHFGMFSLSGGYRLIVPFEENAFDHLHHLFTVGAGFHF